MQILAACCLQASFVRSQVNDANARLPSIYIHYNLRNAVQKTMYISIKIGVFLHPGLY